MNIMKGRKFRRGGAVWCGVCEIKVLIDDDLVGGLGGRVGKGRDVWGATCVAEETFRRGRMGAGKFLRRDALNFRRGVSISAIGENFRRDVWVDEWAGTLGGMR
jgi:hypothetical protein